MGPNTVATGQNALEERHRSIAHDASASRVGRPSSPVRTVEFIGATGAGKTTLARAVASAGLIDPPPVMWTDLITARAWIRWLKDPHLVNLLADLAALSRFPLMPPGDRRFARFAFKRLQRHAPSMFASLNYRRNVIRRVGMHGLARATERATVLFDEGPLLIAYQLYVYTDTPYTRTELEAFARLVPMPDRVVLVKAPIEDLVERALGRSDARRELARRDPAAVRRSIARAVQLFDELSELEPIRHRVKTVQIDADSDVALAKAARSIADWITDGRPGEAGGSRPSSAETRTWRS
jgi:adenylate kinase family enzyme